MPAPKRSEASSTCHPGPHPLSLGLALASHWAHGSEAPMAVRDDTFGPMAVRDEGVPPCSVPVNVQLSDIAPHKHWHQPTEPDQLREFTPFPLLAIIQRYHLLRSALAKLAAG